MDKKSILMQDNSGNVIVPVTTIDDVIVDKDTMLESIVPKRLEDYHIKYTTHYDALGCPCGNANIVAFVTESGTMPYYYTVEYFTNLPSIRLGQKINDTDTPGIYHREFNVNTFQSQPIAMMMSDRYNKMYVVSLSHKHSKLEIACIDFDSSVNRRLEMNSSPHTNAVLKINLLLLGECGDENARNVPHVFVDICPRAYSGRIRYYLFGYGRSMWMFAHNTSQTSNFILNYYNILENEIPLLTNGDNELTKSKYMNTWIVDSVVIKENRKSTVVLLVLINGRMHLIRQVYVVRSNNLVLDNETKQELADLNLIVSTNIAGFPAIVYDERTKLVYASVGLSSVSDVSDNINKFKSKLIPIYNFDSDTIISTTTSEYKKYGNVFNTYKHAPVDLMDITLSSNATKYFNLDYDGYLRIGRCIDDIMSPDYTTSDIYIANKNDKCYFNKRYISDNMMVRDNKSNKWFMYKKGLNVFNIRNLFTGEDDTYLIYTNSAPHSNYRRPLPSGVVVFTDKPTTVTSNILTTRAKIKGGSIYSMSRDEEGIGKLVPREKYGNNLYRIKLYHPLIHSSSCVSVDFYGDNFTFAQSYGILPVTIEHDGYISLFSISDVVREIEAILTFKYNNPIPNLNVLSGHKITTDKIDKSNNIIIRPITQTENADLTITMRKSGVGLNYNNTDNTLSIKNKNSEIKISKKDTLVPSIETQLISSDGGDLVLDETIKIKVGDRVLSLGDLYNLFD